MDNKFTKLNLPPGWYDKALTKNLLGCLLVVFLSFYFQKAYSTTVNTNDLFSSPAVYGQQQVRGVVVDSLGAPLAGATVLIKGTSVATQADKNGAFFFPSLDADAVLIVSFTGFLTQEVAVNNRTQLSIVLKEDASELGEVVVVAFGTQKKTDMVGAVTTIKPSDLRIPSSNLTTALAGQAAGVIAYQRNREPGQDNADFFIRGVTSFGTGKVDPLILIDGMDNVLN